MCHLSRWKPRQSLPWGRESDRNRRPGCIPDPGVNANLSIQGVETVTFKQPTSSETKHVYTVYVEWTAPIGNEDATFPNTNTWVSLTDGTITEEIHMEAKVTSYHFEHKRISCKKSCQTAFYRFLTKSLKVYGGERRWLAGCLLLAGGAEPTFQLRPLNVFFTEKPDEEVNNDLKARIQTFFHPDARPVSRDFWAR